MFTANTLHNALAQSWFGLDEERKNRGLSDIVKEDRRMWMCVGLTMEIGKKNVPQQNKKKNHSNVQYPFV